MKKKLKLTNLTKIEMGKVFGGKEPQSCKCPCVCNMPDGDPGDSNPCWEAGRRWGVSHSS